MPSIRRRIFAAKLLRLRRALKLTQSEVDCVAHLCAFSTYQLERADREPSLDELCNLAHALKVEPAYLVEL